MKPEYLCANHPDVEAISICHHCKDNLCSDCVIKGPRNFYCQKPNCLETLKIEEALSNRICPNCKNPISSDTIQCLNCGNFLRDFTPEEKAESLINIARYGSSIEAHLAKTKLESEGIEAYVFD